MTRFSTKSDASPLRAPDLVKRDFTAARPDALWVADFTYCSTWSGIVYVAFVIDVFSRRLVGWKAARSMTDTLVIDALTMAAWTRRSTTLDGLVCHTDAPGARTPRSPTPYASVTLGRPLPSAPSATATTTRWRNRSWGCSRPSCPATQLHRRPTAARGRGSTTWRSPPAAGRRGSTRRGCIQSSTTGLVPRPRPSIATGLSSVRHERSRPTGQVEHYRHLPAVTIRDRHLRVVRHVLSLLGTPPVPRRRLPPGPLPGSPRGPS